MVRAKRLHGKKVAGPVLFLVAVGGCYSRTLREFMRAIRVVVKKSPGFSAIAQWSVRAASGFRACAYLNPKELLLSQQSHSR